MKIQAKIDRLVNSGATKAIASVTLDSWYVVKGLRVVDGKKGMFVSMPQESYMDKGEKKYSNIFFPITNAAKTELQDAVLKAYDQYLDQQHDAVQDAQFEDQGMGMLPF